MAIEAVLILLVAATALALLARRIGIPYPILLVLGGLALGFVPGLPTIELEPELVFLLFLPPILFGAGYFTSLRDFRRNLRAITLLSVGLVIFTTVAVAVVAQCARADAGLGGRIRARGDRGPARCRRRDVASSSGSASRAASSRSSRARAS